MFERLIDRHELPDAAMRAQLTTIRYKSIGHWFEDWWRARHRLPPRSDAEKNTRGIPDAVLAGVPYSLKCHINANYTISLPQYTFGPEIRYADTYHTGLVIVVYNLWFRQETGLRFASAAAVPDMVTVRNGTTARRRRRTSAEMARLRREG